MSQAWLPATITVATPPRGGGTQAGATFIAQSMNASFAHGVSPGTATIVYVGNTVPLQTGCYVSIAMGLHLFIGICKSDVLDVGSREGTRRVLNFSDLREYLQWDYVFCAFNKPDVRLVGSVRVKRWKHIYPADFGRYTWTYTDQPLMGWQIVNAVLGYQWTSGGTVGSPWVWDLTGNGLFPAGILNFPIYDIDCLGGRRLDAFLSEICEKAGCVLSLMSTSNAAYRLVFTRKGYGGQAVFPANVSDDMRLGVAISGKATNVRVMGERNLYQVLEVPLAKDWATAWEQFPTFESFADDIFRRGTNPQNGVRYNNTVQYGLDDSKENIIGRQLALARALEMTVAQYVAMREQAVLGEGTPFLDTRKYAGRSRMDVPVALYLSTLLYRAYRPSPGFTVKTRDGGFMPLESCELADRLLCKVTHDPVTGLMTADTTQPMEGNGYAIAKGYMVGADLFKTVRSDQFRLDFFTNAATVWQHTSFQIDDSGEGVRFVIFDEPVITAENLLVQVQGHVVINAEFTLVVPQVKAALVFEGEPFSRWNGTWPNVSRDLVENVGGLRAEVVWPKADYSQDLIEIVYADGKTANQKADEFSTALLTQQFYYVEGGYKYIYNPKTPASAFGVQLSSLIDRVQITTSPQGTWEVVDFTNERARDNFEPERELDRATQNNSLFPGQANLRTRADDARKLAAAFRSVRGLAKRLTDLVNGTLGNDDPLLITWYGPQWPIPANQKVPVGRVVRGGQPSPPSTQAQVGSNTVARWPKQTDTTTYDPTTLITFIGVTVRDNEDAFKPFKVQHTGVALVKVRGPVTAGDSVGMLMKTTRSYTLPATPPWDSMVKQKDGETVQALGIVQQDISDPSGIEPIQLVRVRLGVPGTSSPGGKLKQYQYVSMGADHVMAAPYDGTATTGPAVAVAKPYELRYSTISKNVDGDTVTYGNYSAAHQTRTASDAGGSEIQIIVPWYSTGEIIYVSDTDKSHVVVGGSELTLIDANVDGRAWARKYNQAIP
jgi:hypothetical protein